MNRINLPYYQQWLQDRNRSPNTLTNYSLSIKQYGEKNLTTSNLLSYTKKALTKYQPASVQLKTAALKSYAKFKQLKLDWERIASLIPKVQKKFFSTINELELSQLKAVQFEKNHQIYQRNNLILDYLFYSGVRVSELTHLKHSDWEDNHLKVLGKGHKIRYVFLPGFLISIINPYSKDYLFTNCHGKQLTREYIVQLIRKRTEQTQIKKRITPHTFRRSFATLLNNKGARLTTIQKLLGHSNLETTASYIHNSWEELYSDYSRLWREPNKDHDQSI